jgi:antitoxin component YwqK of YwqJK toxin-antitoxin module
MRPRTTPPPLPTERTTNGTAGGSEPPPQPSSRPKVDDIRKKLGDLTETTKAAGHLAIAEARKAKLTNLTLPAAYLALGRDIFAGGRFRSEFPEIFSEIERLQAEFTHLTTCRSTGTAGGTLAEKAVQTASRIKDTAEAKALGLKLDSLTRRLGEIVYFNHVERSGSEALVGAISSCISEIGHEQQQISRQSGVSNGRMITPRRILSFGIGAIVLLSVLALSGKSKQQSQGTNREYLPPPRVTPPQGFSSPTQAIPTRSTEPPVQPTQEHLASEVPDFSKIDFSYDFSKDDTSIPLRTTRATKFEKIEEARAEKFDVGDTEMIGKWADKEGYINRNGNFVLHGRRTIWYEPSRTNKYCEDSWLHGECHGLQRHFYVDGSPKYELVVVHDIPHGHVTRWYSNGQVSEKTSVLNGKENGLHAEWFENGQKKFEVAYVKGRREGPLRAWFEDGRKREESHLRNGQPEGLAKVWWGELREPDELNYFHGQLHGRVIRHLKDGRQFSRAMYAHGVVTAPTIDSTMISVAEFIALMKEGSVRFQQSTTALGVVWQSDAWNEMFGKPQGASTQFFWTYDCKDGVLELAARPERREAGQIVVGVVNYKNRPYRTPR